MAGHIQNVLRMYLLGILGSYNRVYSKCTQHLITGHIGITCCLCSQCVHNVSSVTFSSPFFPFSRLSPKRPSTTRHTKTVQLQPTFLCLGFLLLLFFFILSYHDHTVQRQSNKLILELSKEHMQEAGLAPPDPPPDRQPPPRTPSPNPPTPTRSAPR